MKTCFALPIAVKIVAGSRPIHATELAATTASSGCSIAVGEPTRRINALLENHAQEHISY